MRAPRSADHAAQTGRLPFIDRLFGTYYLPKDVWPQRYGLINSSVPSGFFPQFIAPFARK